MLKRILIIISLFQITTSYSQSWETSSKILEKRKTSVVTNYSKFDVTGIITGKKYDLIYSNNSYKRFFNEMPPMIGKIDYDGVSISNIEIQYDLIGQHIVVLTASKDKQEYVIADLEKVSGFSIGDNKFLKIYSDSVMRDGIYQLAYRGRKSILFIKRQKSQEIFFSGKEAKLKIVPENHFYIKNEYGTFHIKSRKDVLTAYKNSENMLKILKANKTKFNKKNIEGDLILAISLFNESDSFKNTDE